MPVAPDVRLISLGDQLKWLEDCLKRMRAANKPEHEIALQEACIFTVKGRMEGLGLKYE